MRCIVPAFFALPLCLIAWIGPVAAQVRVTPKTAKGGRIFGEPWADVPETFRNLGTPPWPVPTDLRHWQDVDRLKVRQTLLELLGDLPARPDPAAVKVLSKEDCGDYTLERFEFFNGVDMMVPGILAVPKQRQGPVPAILGLHGHSGSKNDYLPNPNNEQSLGWMLVRRGYAVASIDAYFHGERVSKGPRGRLDKDPEMTLFKLHLWQGRTLWGMMVRDDQCLLDYVAARPEINPGRIGATGMSMGCTRSWWLAALDERVKTIVGVDCFTRYEELLAHGSSHGIYYFVPGVLKHFDSEAIYALVAPRPMLMLSGDQDNNAPPDGIEVLEKKVGAVYRLYGQPDYFRSVLYKNTGHEYLPEMRAEMVEWFEKHLPVQPAVAK